MPTLKDLVQDWGGFERLVADLHRTGTVTVERAVVLTGRSGVPRQCDVVVRHREGLYEHLVIIECKHWKKSVSRLHVDALTATVADLNASKGVIMTSKGFQSGASDYAKHVGIDLFLVRELTDEEWGLPGRKFHMILQIVRRTISGLQAENVQALDGDPSPLQLRVGLGDASTRTVTPLVAPQTLAHTTLEEMLEKTSMGTLMEVMKPSFTINGGTKGTFYMGADVVLAPPEGLTVSLNGRRATIGTLKYELGIRIDQSEISIDRSEHFAFALAVENCVSRSVVAATRALDADRATHSALRKRPPDEATGDQEDVYKNGSVCRVFQESWFDLVELNGLKPTSVPAPIQGSVERTRSLSELMAKVTK